ncbi:MAG: sialate O-acetylesterase [Planctomycetota bacterium]|nr:sialate O-acetylesterase [Planctomycetota bacterium]
MNRRNRRLSFVAFFYIFALAGRLLPADVVPASPFTDHMVLQQGMSVPVWGTAAPGETVTVNFDKQHQATKADADGKWMVHLADLSAGGPFEMTIAGSNTVRLTDVLVGEVWLCSGQSNMDFTVARTPKYYFAGTNNEAEEVAAANYPNIRMFSGHWQRAYEPQSRVDGVWKICTPENVREFSAIGYFFARDLQKKLNVPVGIVTETFGASTAESWVSRQALEAVPELKAMLDPFDAVAKNYPAEERKKALEAHRLWEEQIAKSTDIVNRLREPPNRDPANNQHNPTVMYNGMIAPIIPYAIKGVLWYQGESINGGAKGVKLYPLVQATLIKDWRQRWGEGDFPFYIVQLAALKSGNSPAVRQAQATVLSLPNTGMAVTIDIGDAKNVHPKDKQDVGDRLTRIALARAYGEKIEYSGPMYDSMKVEGNVIRIRFTHAEGLTAKGGDLKTFVIAGSDGKFVPAEAKIDGDSVLVGSSAVAQPVAVRYAWENYPLGCNLYNSDGLPAAPFSTNAQ